MKETHRLEDTKVAERAKMTRENRAKQFMPFAALKGYEEALAEKERIVVEKIELTDESKDELDRKLHILKKNDIAEIVYYNNDEYLKITGMVSRIDLDAKIIRIVNTKISFDDLYDIQIAESTLI